MTDESDDEGENDWEVYVDLVETHPRGAGLGRTIMSTLAGLADELGVRLTSTPTPLDDETTKAGLVAFNAKFGFVASDNGPWMVRHPR